MGALNGAGEPQHSTSTGSRELLVKIDADKPYFRTLLIRPASEKPEASEQLEAEQPGVSGRNDEESTEVLERSLQVAGLPCGWGDTAVHVFFTQFGAVESVTFCSAPWHKKGRDAARWKDKEGPPLVARVTFKLKASVKKALRVGVPLQGSSRRPQPLLGPPQQQQQNGQALVGGGGEGEHLVGLRRWIAEYREARPGAAALQQRADAFILAHNARLEEEKMRRAAEAGEEDGWTLVVGKAGRKKSTDAATGVAVGAVAPAVAQKLHAQKALQAASASAPFDFYRFQHREARRNELLELQHKFEQDKKRISQLRAARKFRPY